MWPPTVVAGTLQVNALAYILTGLFCVSVKNQDNYFPLDARIGFFLSSFVPSSVTSRTHITVVTHLTVVTILQWSPHALVWISKAHVLNFGPQCGTLGRL